MERWLLSAAAGLGFLAVAAGAFGAHALKARLPAELMAVFQTGVLYHLIHALAALIAARWTGAALAGWLFVAGVVIFSGSLYALALSGARILGAVTPIGGLCFLAGWALLFWRALRGGG